MYRSNNIIFIISSSFALLTAFAAASGLIFHLTFHSYYHVPGWERIYTRFDYEEVEIAFFFIIGSLTILNRLAFIIWMFFSYRNLQLSGFCKTRQPAFMVLFWFIIPGANFIFPPVLLTELWTQNNRMVALIRSEAFNEDKTLPVVYSVLSIFLFLVNCVAIPLSLNYNRFPAHIYYLPCALIIVTCITTLLFLRKIQAMEVEIKKVLTTN